MRKENAGNWQNRVRGILFCIYFIAILVLFLGELRVSFFGFEAPRATDQVLLLLVLLLLPFVLMGFPQFVRSLSLKFSGKEIHVELSEMRDDVDREVQRVESHLTGQVSNAEQALWPLLAGDDPHAERRLKDRKLIIGAKLDTSQIFFAHLLSQMITTRVPGSRCEVRLNNGGSIKNFADLKYGWIDAYVDFTGTCCQYFNIDHRGKSDAAIIDELNTYGQALGMRWLAPTGASEDYCLVISKKASEKFGVTAIPQLSTAAPRLRFSADPEFLNRRDCYLGLKNRYHLKFAAVKPCHINNRYGLLESEEADVFVGYETDPELKYETALRLEDPNQFFPRYLAVALVRRQALDHIPELEASLNRLTGALSTEQLIGIVMELSQGNKHPAIAETFAKKVVASL